MALLTWCLGWELLNLYVIVSILGLSILTYFIISVDNTISVYVDYERGKNLADILAVNGEVFMTIAVGRTTTSPTTAANNGQFTANNTSVLFVSISFIVLIIISLAWLVFYYIQRCRYTNAKERLSVSIGKVPYSLYLVCLSCLKNAQYKNFILIYAHNTNNI